MRWRRPLHTEPTIPLTMAWAAANPCGRASNDAGALNSRLRLARAKWIWPDFSPLRWISYRREPQVASLGKSRVRIRAEGQERGRWLADFFQLSILPNPLTLPDSLAGRRKAR